MKFRKLIHHILITIGLALGVIATGTTVNAKAQQLNSNNTNNNNPSSDQNINSNQFQNPTNVLINIPRQNQNFYNDNTYNQNNFNNDHYNNEYVQDDSDMRYQRSNLSSQNYNDQSNYQNSPASPKFNPANLSNYNPSQEQVNFNKTNNSAKDLYKDILLNTARHFNNKNNNRNTPSKSKNSTIANKTDHIKTHTMKLSAATGKSTQHRLRPVHKNYRKSRHWFRDGLSRQNLKARSWVSWHESNHRWRVLSYGGVCVGYFQLSPSYLGYKHGHVNLNKRHQVKVADAYVRGRYGNWINAKRFWETHHWY